jgi:hypothetical protein
MFRATIAALSALALATAEGFNDSFIVRDLSALGLVLDKSTATVSGLSSGAFMAVQVHVAFSGTFGGAGQFAGGPYYCAQNSLNTATIYCMNGAGTPNGASLATFAQQQASLGKIDSTGNLANDKVYLYSGTLDTVVSQKVAKTTYDFYRALGVTNIRTEWGINSQHCTPTVSYGNACYYLGSPYINKCSYDGAYQVLSTFYSLGGKTTPISSNLVRFDQTPYISDTGTSLESYGYMYIPTNCKNGATCKLHFNFHGCSQGVSTIGTTYMTECGYNDWAESNNIVVVYPSVGPSSALGNPNGCWDWWGYTGSNYAFKDGKQMKFVKNLYNSL